MAVVDGDRRICGETGTRFTYKAPNQAPDGITIFIATESTIENSENLKSIGIDQDKSRTCAEVILGRKIELVILE